MKKILVGVDGSMQERAVLRTAIALAGPLGAKVSLVRAVGLPTQRLPFGVLSLSPDDVEKAMLDAAKEDLAALIETIPAPVRGEARAVPGTPMPVIEETAKEMDVDLIVIGSHGHGAIDRILGSTAAKVVNHSDRSVLVVRAAGRLVAGA